jgi:hypothetical protein
MWRNMNNNNVVRVVKSSTVEKIMKTFFEKVYGKPKAQQLEMTLNNLLERYEGKENLYEVK